jgi:hypothetical protein
MGHVVASGSRKDSPVARVNGHGGHVRSVWSPTVAITATCDAGRLTDDLVDQTVLIGDAA